MKYQIWLHEWLENYVKPSSKIRTYEVYNGITEKYLIPEFGEKDIDRIDPLMVQKFVTRLLQCGNMKTGEGLSASTVNTIIVVIQSSLRTAYMMGVTKEYEMNKIKRPKVEENQVDCFSKEEQKKIENAAMQDKRLKMRGIVLCLYTGLRIGELMALEWSDIDFEKGELSVKRACHDGKDKDGKFTRITGTPKTHSSVRTIPIPKQIIPMLKQMKKGTTSKYVVSEGKGIISVRSYQRSFELLLKRIGVQRKGFHSLRHTFATRALECGMDVKTLSEVLGHKNPTVTLQRYVHSLPEHKRELMNRIGKLL